MRRAREVPSHSQTIAVENVSVISKLKRFKARHSATPPKTAELRQTLTGVSASGNLYLKVSGTGVTPIGGACQAQAGSVQLPPGLSLVVKDAANAVVGVLVATLSDHNAIRMRQGGLTFLVTADSTGFRFDHGFAYFAASDCTGTPLWLSNASLVPTGVVRSGTGDVYVPSAPGSDTFIGSMLDWSSSGGPLPCGAGTPVPPDACCSLWGSTLPSMAPLSVVDVSGFVPPFFLQPN